MTKIILLTSFCFLLTISVAQEDVSGKFAILTELQGIVEVSHDGGSYWQKATQGDFLAEGDWVRTQTASEATIAFDYSSLNTVTVQENTSVRIDQLRNETDPSRADYSIENPGGEITSLLIGLQPGDLFQIQTPTMIVAARGTEFTVNYNTGTGQTTVQVYEGEVQVSPPGGGTSQSVTAPVAAGHPDSGRYIVKCVVTRGGIGTPEVVDLAQVGAGALNDDVRNRMHAFGNAKVEVQKWLKSHGLVERDPGFTKEDWENLKKKKSKWLKEMQELIEEMEDENSIAGIPSQPPPHTW